MELGILFSTEFAQERVRLTVVLLCVCSEEAAIKHFTHKALSFDGQGVELFLGEGGVDPFHPLECFTFAGALMDKVLPTS